MNEQAPYRARVSVVRAALGSWAAIAATTALSGGVAAQTGQPAWLGGAALAALWGAALWLRAATTHFTVSGTEVRYAAGILWRRKGNVTIAHVRRVEVHAGPIERLLGIGTLAVWTSGDLPEVVVAGIAAPQHAEAALNEARDAGTAHPR